MSDKIKPIGPNLPIVVYNGNGLIDYDKPTYNQLEEEISKLKKKQNNLYESNLLLLKKLRKERERTDIHFRRANTIAEALKQSSAKELDLLNKVDALTLENRMLKGENEQTKRCIETLQGSNARLFAYTERLRSWKGRFLNLFGLCRLR